jgi:hypothetical protein
MDELIEILNSNAERRAAARQRQIDAERDATDLADQVTHPYETAQQRARRREREAERERLRRLGVKFDD